jgi:hypothetical protein
MRRKCGCSSVVERHLAKVKVWGSNPHTRLERTPEAYKLLGFRNRTKTERYKIRLIIYRDLLRLLEVLISTISKCYNSGEQSILINLKQWMM